MEKNQNEKFNEIEENMEREKRNSEKEIELSSKEKYLEKFFEELKEKEKKLELRKAESLDLERKIIFRENELKNKEDMIEIELQNKKTESKNNLQNEINEIRKKRLEEIDSDLKNYRETEYNKIKNEMNLIVENNNKRLQEEFELKQKKYNLLQEKILEIEKRENDVNIEEENLKNIKLDIDRKRRKIEEIEEELQERIDNQVRKEIQIEKDTFEIERENFNKRIEELKTILKQKEEKISSYNTFIDIFGNTPEILKNELENKQVEIRQLNEELSKRPSIDIEERLEREERELQEKRELLVQNEERRVELERELEERQAEILESQNIKNRNIELENIIKNNENSIDSLQGQLDEKRKELERLSYPEGRESTREQRIQEIEKGKLPEIYSNKGKNIIKNEIEWLENIYNNCNEYGLKFNKWILYAFHTALKISDWSIMTVLAGVSGTGKSELPKLYSVFGGLNFESVAVQPNWDSQESMLGYFNSIDNRFDAQPLLRFLAQVTKENKTKAEDETFPPSNCMSLILLDEMNLAHVEHYFADFLSKLEERRSKSKDDLPTVEIKLGSGLDPYNLKMSRTLLWTGTMNQDETTKSLSDKVLDRGIVINFPRPRKLESRKGNKITLEKFKKDKNIAYLTKDIWNKWIKRENELKKEQNKKIQDFKKIVESINDALEGAGRALGHRVWQSIEFYILNYPLVLLELEKSNEDLTEDLAKKMEIAFEDQIVQKIMPKLRGIEVRGNDGKVLDKIKKILQDENFENLIEDFEFAREHGYGQFIWSSAKYLEKRNLEDENKIEVEE
ncbi:hypothetical protein [uncultured Leptotrichia sp.]|jgi:translation initiation factor IF-2, N-terminal domain protein|uniref:hypothetical protein n=1 Tax=uncultured Leptotrichia sp. TaxID=159271 RepID=UPI002611828A|nr:hypothetical protein [uncultured Leptotrichia sp.]